jgi:hypothetical protein
MIKTPQNQGSTNMINLANNNNTPSASANRKKTSFHDFSKMNEIMNYLNSKGHQKDAIEVFLDYLNYKENSRAD